jgi:DNA-directed RNA polymerase specialized sigma24 family protein
MTEKRTRTDPGSLSCQIPGLKQGNRVAVESLWRHFFEPLVRVACGRVNPGLRRGADHEDVAVEAFLGFCSQLARPGVEQRFPRLRNRQDLWKLLVCFTVRGASDFVTKVRRRHRILAGGSALGPVGFDGVADGEPGPELAGAVDDLIAKLPNEDLREVARLRMAGCTNQEIAGALDRGVKTVELKLARIRGYWKADWDALGGENELEGQT